jgi:KaiC/GvpD/RAD55 family RecA-like ATPase
MVKLYTTGSADLDILVGGGIPDRTTTIVHSHPGSGAEVLAWSILHRGLQEGADGIYFTSNQAPEDIVEDMGFFGWDVSMYYNRTLHFIDAFTPRYRENTDEKLAAFKVFAHDLTAIDQIEHALFEEVKKTHGECRCVVDSLSFILQNNDPEMACEFFDRMRMMIKRYGGTCVFILVDGMHDKKVETTLLYLADNVIHFSRKIVGHHFMELFMNIYKFKKMVYNTRNISYRIGREGLIIDMKERIM